MPQHPTVSPITMREIFLFPRTTPAVPKKNPPGKCYAVYACVGVPSSNPLPTGPPVGQSLLVPKEEKKVQGVVKVSTPLPIVGSGCKNVMAKCQILLRADVESPVELILR